MPGRFSAGGENTALRQRVRSAIARSARAGPALPDPGRKPDLRVAGVARPQLRDRAGARGVVAAGRTQALAVQASPQREVPRRDAVYRGRRRVLDRARAGQEFAARVPAAGRPGSAQGRRPDGRLRARGPRCGAAGKIDLRRHDEQGVVSRARRRRSRRTTTPSRKPTRFATPTAPALYHSRLRVRRPLRAGRQSALVGPARQRRRGDLCRHPVRRDAAWPRSFPGRSISSSIRRSRTFPACKRKAASSSPRSPTSARNISASTRAATSCSSAT